MPYKKPVHKKGAWEPKYLHYLKLCWFEVHFEDVTNEISRKYFVTHFFEIAESMALFEKIETLYGITWEWYNEDGTPKGYDYSILKRNSIFRKYGWNDHDELYKAFKIDKLQSTHDTACERVERSKDKHTLEDIKEYQKVTQRITHLQRMQEAGIDCDKEIKQNEQTKSIISDRISKRLGLDELNVNLDGKLDVDAIIQEGTYSTDEINELQKVSSKPDKETQRFLDKL